MFGWNRVRLGSHECSFYLLLDDSHVSVPAALPNLRALRRGVLAHWHTGTLRLARLLHGLRFRVGARVSTIGYNYVKSTLCRTVRPFPGFRLQGIALAREKTKTALHGFRPRGWAVGVPARSISILQYSIRKSIFEGE